MNRLAAFLCCVCATGCSLMGLYDAPPTDGDAGSDSDVDSDTDSDADADSDSDSDCPDADEDGYFREKCGGDDCNDFDQDTHPGALDEEWVIVDLPEVIGTQPSIVVETSGVVHIASIDKVSEELQYLYDREGPFVERASIVASGTTMWRSIAVDGAGFGHIAAFSETDAALRYLRVEDPDIDEDLVATGSAESGMGPAITLDTLGVPTITFFDLTAGRLALATSNDGIWDIVTLDASTGLSGAGENDHVSMVTNGGSIQHACYTLRCGPADHDLRCVKVDRGNPTSVHADEDEGADRGEFHALAMDATDVVHLVYSDSSDGALFYKAWLDEKATTELTAILGPTMSRGHFSLATDAAGMPHLVFENRVTAVVTYATMDEDVWTTEPIEAGTSPAIAFGPESVHIVFDGDGVTRYAKRAVPNGNDDDCNGTIW